jgi:serine protease
MKVYQMNNFSLSSKVVRNIILLIILTISASSDATTYSVIVQLPAVANVHHTFKKSNYKNNNLSNSIFTPIEVLSKSMNIHLLDVNSDLNKKDIIDYIYKSYPIISAQHNQKVFSRCTTPNDLRFPDQWHLRNTGQNGGTSGADIHACEAWDIPQRVVNAFGDTIVVAVIDVAADLSCTQINWFKNYAEIPNNAIDDDGNGYVDDYDGWNSIDNNGTVQMISGEYHHTMIAGVIGAKGNDTVGVAGVHWGVKVLPIVGSNLSDEADIVQAYAYCIDMKKLYMQTNGAKGAYIIASNSSFGSDDEWGAAHPIWCAMYDSMGRYGILSATSAPNKSVDIDVVGDMPSTCASNFMIVVSGTNYQDKKNTSGIGKKYIDIHAPAEGIISTKPGNTFGSGNGTSYSAPMICGALSMMISQASDTLMDSYDKGDTNAILYFKKTLLENVDTLASLKNFSQTEGRLNVFKAIKGIKKTYKKHNAAIGVVQNEFGYYISDKKINFEENIELIDKVAIYNQIGMVVLEHKMDKFQKNIDASYLPNGIYFLQIQSKENTFTDKIIIE